MRMYRTLLLSGPISFGVLILGGCSSTEKVQTYVRDAEVYGPVMSIPVHVVSENSRNAVTVSAHATLQKSGMLRGKVEGSNAYLWRPQWDSIRQADGTILPDRGRSGENLFWHRPEYSGGVHVDLAWETTALSFGGTIAAQGGTTRAGWLAGLGFFTRDSSPVRVRLDVGLFGQVMDFETRAVTVTSRTSNWWGGSSSSVDTAFYYDRDSESGLGYYGALTINTANATWPFNLFVQVNCVVQSLFNYTPVSQTTVDWVFLVPIESGSGTGKVTTSTTFLGITPGIYIEPSRSTLLLAGVRYMVDMSGTLLRPDYVLMPFVQFSLRVGDFATR